MSCQVIGLGYVARLLQEREAMLASWALSSTEKCRVLLPLFVFCPPGQRNESRCWLLP